MNSVGDKIYHMIKTYGDCLNFAKGEIYYLNNSETHLYAFENGVTFLKQSNFDGKEIISKIYTKEKIFVDISNASSQFEINHHFYTKEKTVVYRIDEKSLGNKVGSSYLTTLILKYTANEIKKTELKLGDYIFHGKKGALLSNIIRLSNSFGVIQKNGDILLDIYLSHEDFSQLCGMSRERITKYLTKLKQDNVIEYNKNSKKIIIKDLSHIKKQFSCENCPAYLCNIF